MTALGMHWEGTSGTQGRPTDMVDESTLAVVQPHGDTGTKQLQGHVPEDETFDPPNLVGNPNHTYTDEESNYYPSHARALQDPYTSDASLVRNAADIGKSGNYHDLGTDLIS